MDGSTVQKNWLTIGISVQTWQQPASWNSQLKFIRRRLAAPAAINDDSFQRPNLSLPAYIYLFAGNGCKYPLLPSRPLPSSLQQMSWINLCKWGMGAAIIELRIQLKCSDGNEIATPRFCFTGLKLPNTFLIMITIFFWKTFLAQDLRIFLPFFSFSFLFPDK